MDQGDIMLRLLASAILCVATPVVAEQYIAHATLPYQGPVAYADKTLQTVFYAESDGHHVSAIGFDGKVLWTRDLYADTEKAVKGTSKGNPAGESEVERIFREERSRRKIVSINRGTAPNPSAKSGDRNKLYLSIAFSSADFCIIDAATGNPVLWGRD
jgi:hypothetical protein